MSRLSAVILAFALMGLGAQVTQVDGAPDVKLPHIGYLYPAGGRQGTVVRVEVGGMNLRGARQVFVSGEGVTAKLVDRLVPNRRLKNELLQELRRRLTRLVREKTADRPPTANRPRRGGRDEKPGKADSAEAEVVELPDHPLLRDLESMSLRELEKVAEFFFDPSLMQQSSPQIAETVALEVTIAPGAAPGRRDLRVLGPLGLSNPLLFSVGLLPEVCEAEINDFDPESLPPLAPAVVLNGQIVRRDVDRFRFEARKGQALVFETEARRLVPYMADAVPGWFQAVLTLRDARGEEVLFSDDYRFDPDPVMLFTVPEDGAYELEVRDAIDRGREDFVYRITIGEKPFVTRRFPLGGRAGTATAATVAGWNLPWSEVALDTRTRGGSVRPVAFRSEAGLTNHLLYAVDDLPESFETEPNDDRGRAVPTALPRILNGRIDRAGDVDCYRFEGRGGDRIVAEVYARRLGSPVDSLLTLRDAEGLVLARNDDRDAPRTGLFTHLADSWVAATLPADGVYFVEVADTQNHGGEEYAYRLRISAPRPDFTVMVTPSALSVPAGSTIEFTAHALRCDGFEGDIRLELKNPPGFVLAGARIPAGKDRVRLTLTAPSRPEKLPLPLAIEGVAEIGGRAVRHPVVPAEDVMQAFLWRHLVPTEELLVAITGSSARIPPMRYAGAGPARLPAGGTALVMMAASRLPDLANVRFELSDPPAGVTLRDVGADEKGLLLVLDVDEETAVVGTADNLIVEVYAMVDANRGRAGKDAPAKGPAKLVRYYVGVLPAIPVEVVAR